MVNLIGDGGNNDVMDVKFALNKLMMLVSILDNIDANFIHDDSIIKVYRLNEELMDQIAMLSESIISSADKSQMIEEVVDIRVIISRIKDKLGER